MKPGNLPARVYGANTSDRRWSNDKRKATNLITRRDPSSGWVPFFDPDFSVYGGMRNE